VEFILVPSERPCSLAAGFRAFGVLSPKCSYLQRISIPADFKIPSAIRSQAYHFGGTGIHWSMTGVVSVAPYCLNFGLRLLFACRLTDPIFFEVDCISMLVKMAWLIFRVETTQRSRLLVSVRKNVVSRTHVHRHHKPRQRLLHTVQTTRGLPCYTTASDIAQSLTPFRLPYHLLLVNLSYTKLSLPSRQRHSTHNSTSAALDTPRPHCLTVVLSLLSVTISL
jgi:hypothetical protein